MNFCRFLLLISPLLIGLIVPFLPCLIRDPHAPQWLLRGCRRILATVGALFLILSLCAIVGAEPLMPFLSSLLFLLSFTILLTALFFFLSAIGLTLPLCQILVSCIVILMVGTPFFLEPLLEATGERGAEGVDWTVRLNPALIVGGSILKMDPLKEAIVYRFSSLSFYKVRYPTWWIVSLGYVVVALPLIAVVAVRRYRRKKDCDGTLLTTNPLC